MLSRIKKLIPLDFPLRIWFHKFTGYLAALYYGFPARNMNVIGVTGTNGKTTVVHLIAQILTNVNKKVGMASTVGFQIDEKYIQNKTHKTTLGRFQLQKLLSRMKKQGCDVLVLECSSHALSQGRLNGIPFTTAVFTNLTREHLDYHRTMERYFNEKKKLFMKVSSNKASILNSKKGKNRILVVNTDDEYGQRLLSVSSDIVVGASTNDSRISSDAVDMITASDIQVSDNGISFVLNYNGQKIPIDSSLIGDYNVMNLLLASGVAIAHGVSLDVLRLNLNTFAGIPGRLEKVGKTSSQAEVYIDYAVTPDSFELLFESLRKLTTGDLIAVFGSCGDRDAGKRPNLGKIAAEMCDRIIVTNEEPYTEDPEHIIDQIFEGVHQTSKEENKDVFRISDREEAIKFALEHTKKGDIVVVTGIGDQTSMTIGTEHIPWSDREVIQKYL